MQRMLTAGDIHFIKTGDKVVLKIISRHLGDGEFDNSPGSAIDIEAEKEYTIASRSIVNHSIRVEKDGLHYRIERFATGEPDPPTEAELSSALKFDESILDNIGSINFRPKS